MKINKFFIFFIVFIIFFVNFFSNISYGYNLELILSSDKTNVKIGDEVNITLSISKGMQAADFTINYDSDLLEFKSASIGNNFYNATLPGKIICSWFDTKDTKEFNFIFVAKNEGVALFSTTTENFYDGNLNAASTYTEGKLNVQLLSSGINTNNIKQVSDNNITSNIENINLQSVQSTSNNLENQKQNNNITSKVLPQTGDNTIILCLFGVILAIIAIIAKMKFNLLKDI